MKTAEPSLTESRRLGYFPSLGKPVDEQPMAQAAVADRQGILLKLVHHRLDDARPSKDDVRPLRLQADNRAPVVQRLCAVHLDLAIDLGTFEYRSLNDAGIVLRQTVLDRRDVRDGAAHSH